MVRAMGVSENAQLISIIVPIYNVESYLDECIESIIHQTYENLEIILVNDGSTDKSEIICEKYRNNDNRIKYLYKDNGGSGSARNLGLSMVHGNYVSFVDSDDFIELNMIEKLYSIIKSNDADIAFCTHERYGDINHPPTTDGSIKKYDIENYLLEFSLGGKVATPSAWQKLYKSTLIANIKFPEGTYSEDLIWTAKVIINSHKIVFLNEALYHYRIREHSITSGENTTSAVKEQVITQHLRQMLETSEYIKSKGYDIASEVVKVSYIIMAANSYCNILKNQIRELKKYLPQLLKISNLSQNIKIDLIKRIDKRKAFKISVLNKGIKFYYILWLVEYSLRSNKIFMNMVYTIKKNIHQCKIK